MQTPGDVIAVGEGFWNLRGAFRLGPFDIGTQASLVALEEGGHVILDACDLSEEGWRWLDEATEGGATLKGVLHLHPFHTVFVKTLHERYPAAPLYGTRRHETQAPDLPWEAVTTDDPGLHERFARDLRFTVPAGVELIPDDEKLHFSSVLAIHPRSKTLHVDDTLMALRMPWGLRWITEDVIRFHPTLGQVLEEHPQAAAEFRAWAQELAARCGDLENLCAAHTRSLLGVSDLGVRVEAALGKVEGKLARHERRHGA